MKLPRLSITARLALLFCAIAAGVFVAVGAYLYQTLQRQMAARDDAALLGKVVLIRQVLQTRPMPLAMPEELQMVLDNVFGQDGMLLRLTTQDGRTVAQTTDEPLPVGQLPAVPLARAPHAGDVRDWSSPAGPARAIAAEGSAGAGNAPVLITIARDRSDRLAILKRYAADLLGAFVLGALLAAGLAFVTVRHALRPLRDVARNADAIHANRLNTRLEARAVPAELRPLAVAFNAMLDRLEEGVQRLSGFAADLAHDLRTPVNALMMETQVALARPRTAEEYQALLASNLEEYERLGRMIENTLFLARADNAQLALRREVLDAQAELARIRDYFDVLADDAGVALRLDAAGSVYADAVLLRRAVGNLLSNAVQHTPPGGHIVLAARDGAIAVTNTGEPVPAALAERIFERYVRADPARGDGAGSAGLGLAIVRAIMQLHGGSATLATTADGNTFTLRFPPVPAGAGGDNG
ncbi:two-component system heavy metal sensor histidine kinase CusS [Pseudoduganella flava]|uniref:Sensor protein n=1 Tax=Pseudoduganella flava TaxID=871742 RepID=A0A562PDW8_9BURK|nr:heavy metal sensor histidine kinase [Pseudoduganella flava]TWI42176.1 two-component system heavy metal sensor histidine kinase CusS [Pseudoduganella flava]